MSKVGRPKGTTKKRKDIYKEEFEIVLKHLDHSTKMKQLTVNNATKSFFLLYYFGLRVSEVSKLVNRDIKLMVKNKIMSLPNNTKTKKPREAYISNEHVGILEEVFKKNLLSEDKHFVVHSSSNPMSNYTNVTLMKMLNKIIKEALGEQYSTHSFRAGYASILHHGGYDIYTIKEMLGHSSINTTQVYITASERQKKEAAASIPTVAYGA